MAELGTRAVRGGTSPEAVGEVIALLRRLNDGGSGVTHLMTGPRADPRAVAARISGPSAGIDVVIETSGSTTGQGRLVGLTARALFSSATATLARLGGPGQWLTSLPVHHVAGLQVLTRSVVAALDPVVWEGTGPESFADAARQLRRGVPHYLSLVPTQLVRLLSSDPGALSRFSAILVGGAALPAPLATHAEAEGVRVVRTYGSSETSGGCVYDGVPLDGVSVRLFAGRIQIAGPVLASRYLDGGDQPFAYDGEGIRWFTTSDLGEWQGGRLAVLGRADDVVISGGVNVAPLRVEETLSARLGGTWVVVGLPDPVWGARVTAVTDGDATLSEVRVATAALAPAERPRALLTGAAIPLRGPGKVDRRAVAEMAEDAAASGRLERHG